MRHWDGNRGLCARAEPRALGARRLLRGGGGARGGVGLRVWASTTRTSSGRRSSTWKSCSPAPTAKCPHRGVRGRG